MYEYTLLKWSFSHQFYFFISLVCLSISSAFISFFQRFKVFILDVLQILGWVIASYVFFGTTVNGNVAIISSSINACVCIYMCMHTKSIDLYKLILYPATLLKVLISAMSLKVQISIVYYCNIYILMIYIYI